MARSRSGFSLFVGISSIISISSTGSSSHQALSSGFGITVRVSTAL